MPPYGIAQFYDEVYNDDPFNINRRNSEIIIGADGKAKTIPILPMTSDEIMAGSLVPPDFNTDRFRSIFPTSGIMTQAPLGFDTSFRVANEPDEEQEFLPDQESKVAKLFEFLQKFSPSNMVMGGLNALGSMLNFKDSPMYRPAGIGVYGYTPAQLNQMNALGGYYSEPMRAYRRNVNRISNLMRRAAADKSYSQKNLDKLMTQVGMGDVDTGAMIDSIKASSETGYGIGDVGQAATPGRDYSSSPGAMAGDMEY